MLERAIRAEQYCRGLPPLHAALDELERRGWLTSEPRGYAFVARLVRDVIERDMVTPAQRRRILDAARRPP